MATDTYVYPGEPLESDQIRLIRVQPGEWKEPIVCDLYNTRHTSFDDKSIPYYTLSYVWGSRGASREVILSGRPCKVTVNLERALRYYRHHYPNGADLWADALCIDQTNVTERTYQVRLMGQIYSKCKKMVIYLGDRLEYASRKGPDDEHNFRAASGSDIERQRCSARPAIQLIRELSSNSHLSEMESFQSQEDLDYILESLRRLVHAPFTPWWDRVWVVQEAALAPGIDVMQGFNVLPWLELAHAATNFKVHSTSCCLEHLACLPRDCIKVLEDFTKRVLAVHESRGNIEIMSLPSLLCTFRNRQASDPRDKVYALLSLTASNIVPDYSISEVDVFCAATRECIVSSRNLAVFNNDLGRKWREDLPSWVPDWGSPSSPIMDARAEIAAMCYNTSPGFSAEVLCHTGGNLQVAGKEIRKICEIGDIMWGETTDIIEVTLLQWWTILPRRLRRAFWRTICGDVIASEVGTSFRRCSPADEKTFAAWTLMSDQSPYRSYKGHGVREHEMVKAVVERLEREARDPFKLYDDVEKLLLLENINHFGRYRMNPQSPLDPKRLEPYDPSALYDWYNIHKFPTPPTGAREKFPHELAGLPAYLTLPWHLALPVLVSHKFEKASRETQDNVSAFERSVGIATVFRRLIIFGNSRAEQIVERIVERHEWLRSKGRGASRSLLSSITFSSVEQKVGLGPSGAQVGDSLFILEGAKTPLILRPVDSSGTHYKMIGDCYVDGMMDDCTGSLSKGEWEKIWLV